MRKGTLDNLVHAFGALFTLNVLHKDSEQYLVTSSVIHVGDSDRKQTLLPAGPDEPLV